MAESGVAAEGVGIVFGAAQAAAAAPGGAGTTDGVCRGAVAPVFSFVVARFRKNAASRRDPWPSSRKHADHETDDGQDEEDDE